MQYCGRQPSAMRDAVSSFEGVEHRLEDVGQVDCVAYVNDSIATTPSRTIAALLAVERPIVLIAGGYDKNLPFDEMADAALGKVHTVVLLGVTADKIEKAFVEAARRAGGSEPPEVVRAAALKRRLMRRALRQCPAMWFCFRLHAQAMACSGTSKRGGAVHSRRSFGSTLRRTGGRPGRSDPLAGQF